MKLEFHHLFGFALKINVSTFSIYSSLQATHLADDYHINSLLPDFPEAQAHLVFPPSASSMIYPHTPTARGSRSRPEYFLSACSLPSEEILIVSNHQFLPVFPRTTDYVKGPTSPDFPVYQSRQVFFPSNDCRSATTVSTLYSLQYPLVYSP